ncbi:MAG: CRISPR-associated endoribonuclease Cas6 [Caldilineaceae bacterium]
MLTSLHITLTPTAPVALPAWLGRATHAWFLESVGQMDPALAEKLHTPNQARPFTVSDLWGPGLKRQGQNRLTPGTLYSLRITGCRADISSLIGQMAQQPPQAIRLLDHPFAVQSASLDPAVSRWAGQTTYESLAQRQMLAQEQPRQRTLHFASPTVFRSNDAYVPLPLPKLVFEGLARQWNSLSAVTIADEVVRFADECLLISRYRLQTERVDRGQRGGLPGFVGSCTYAFKVQDRYWMGLIHLLADFAFYAGVGKQTAMGLGQIGRDGNKEE